VKRRRVRGPIGKGSEEGMSNSTFQSIKKSILRGEKENKRFAFLLIPFDGFFM